MSNNRKIIMGLCFSMVMHVSFSMDELPKKEQQVTSLSGQLSGISHSSGGQQQILQNGSLWNSFATGLKDVVVSGCTSAYRTVKNTVSTSEMLIELGYPVSDPRAQEALQRLSLIYQQIEPHYLKNNNDLKTVTNRTTFITEVFCSLKDQTEAVAIVQHIKTHHSAAMNHRQNEFAEIFLSEKKKELGVDQKEGSTSVESKTALSSSSSKQEFDMKMLVKIGYPVTEQEDLAATWLKRCNAAYTIRKALKTAEGRALLQTQEGCTSLAISNEDTVVQRMLKDSDQVRRRIEQVNACITQLYHWLKKFPDGIQIAVFCLKNHPYVMPESMRDDYLLFIEETQKNIMAIATQVISTSEKQAAIMSDSEKQPDGNDKTSGK